MSAAGEAHQLIHTTLLRPAAYRHPVKQIEFVSTHISQIYLTGDYVYKIKKPVRFSFLDFSTPELRKHYCAEEIRLNRRFAPDLYLRVVAISYRDGRIWLDDDQGEVIEYAVLMRQFNRQQELDFLLQQGKLTSDHIEELAEAVAAFHDKAEPADKNSAYGDANSVIQPVRDNFSDLYAHPHSAVIQDDLKKLEDWVEQEWTDKQSVAAERKTLGYIRECHGDLHLGNVAIINDKVTPFDGIEFDPSLYQIDVMSDLAFPLMDLEYRQQYPLANQLLNTYLSHTGDYHGLQLLPLYKVHRALVRAKINTLLAAQQKDAQDKKPLIQQAEHYIRLAGSYTTKHTPVIFITHGLSGSGKTWQSRIIARQNGLIHLRSDVERKRLFAAADDPLYSAATTEQTYQHLQTLSRSIISAGFSVIVDATFLGHRQREAFRQLARQLQAKSLILHFATEEPQLRENIIKRQRQGQDASDADLQVLDLQLQHYQPLQADEDQLIITFGQDLPLQQISRFTGTL